MAVNTPTWSMGKSVLFTSSGSTVVNGDPKWSFGKSVLYHEYIAPVAGGNPWYYYAQQE